MRKAPHWLLAALLALGGCTDMDRLFNPAATQAAPLKVPEESQWWRAFNDPLMNELAQRLWVQNLDLRIAQQRISEARGLERQQRSGWFPSVDATGSAQRGNDGFGQTGPATILQGGFDATWELDLFGRTSAAVDAAQARRVASEASAQEVQQSVLAELLRSIVQWRQEQARLATSTTLEQAQAEEVELLSVRQQAGLSDASALASARAQQLEIAAEIPLARAGMQGAQAQMERLLGLDDGALSERLQKEPPRELAIPTAQQMDQLPLQALAQRPDVRVARAELVAAQADLREAEAALWPRISLTGFFGARDVNVPLPLAGNPIWSLAGSIGLPLLDFGRLRGAIDSADARANAAMLRYEDTARRAAEETRIALSDSIGSLVALDTQQRSLADRKDALGLAKERNRRGLRDMTDVTTAQTELDRASLLVVERRRAAALAYIRLQKSLSPQLSPAVSLK